MPDAATRTLTLGARLGRATLSLLKNPWTSLAALLLGILLGKLAPELGTSLARPGRLYLTLFVMAVLPIIPAAIITGVAPIVRSPHTRAYFTRLAAVFLSGALLAASAGLLAGLLLQPGRRLAESSQAFLGRMLLVGSQQDSSGPSNLWDLIYSIIPGNVFQAFAGGEVMAMIFVSVLLGVAIGLSTSEPNRHLLRTIEGFFDAFKRILNWILYGLPPGILCVSAGQVATMGGEGLAALSRFLIAFYGAGLTLAAIYLLCLRIATGRPLRHILSALRKTLIVSFASSSSSLPIPVAIEALAGPHLQRPRNLTRVVVPLGVLINRQGSVVLFALTSVFLAQMYGKPLDLGTCMLIVFTSTILGTAAAGKAGLVAPMVAYVSDLIGVPSSVGVMTLMTIGVITDPLMEMTNIFAACASTAVVAQAVPDHTLAPLEDDPDPLAELPSPPTDPQ